MQARRRTKEACLNLGIVGLGRMGSGIARRAARAGFRVTVYNRSILVAERLAAEEPNVLVASSLDDLTARLPTPRCIWVMLPSGEPTESAVARLGTLLTSGDVLIDGGNSHYRDSIRRHEALAARGISMIDVGTSGGVHGQHDGYCLMIGGDADRISDLSPLFSALAASGERGWCRVGPSGSGHFTKMIHNGIEYGLMQAYAEGFELLRKAPEFDLDLRAIAEVWQRGSVVRSWLLDLVASALERSPLLSDVAPSVADSGEGRWTVAEAVERGVAAPVITAALLARIASRDREGFSARLVAALRREFGGHAVQPSERPDA